MHFNALALLATSLMVAALPSYPLLDNILPKKAPCLDNQVHLNELGDSLDYPFKLNNTKSGQFIGVEYNQPWAPVVMGFETVFTLQNGRLAPKDKNSNGDDLEVAHSLLRIYPPRVALLSIRIQDYPDLPVKAVVSEAADALFIMPDRNSMTHFSERVLCTR